LDKKRFPILGLDKEKKRDFPSGVWIKRDFPSGVWIKRDFPSGDWRQKRKEISHPRIGERKEKKRKEISHPGIG
jgi:hypothetical protein